MIKLEDLKAFTFVSILFYFSLAVSAQDPYYTEYFSNNDCTGDVIEGKFNFFSLGGEDNKMYDLQTSSSNVKLFFKEQEIDKQDSILIREFESVELQYEIVGEINSHQHYFTYATSMTDEIEVPMNIGSFEVSSDDISNGSTKTFQISDNCSDSVKVYFPYGGTVSSVLVQRDSMGSDFSRSVNYGMFRRGNFIKFSTNEVGKYYVRFHACHWGGNMWLELR